MTRQVRTSQAAAFDLGYPIVWWPKYRRPALGGRTKTRLQRSGLPTLWPRSCFVATTGAVSAQTVRRCIDTQNERAPEAGGRA
ncbi:hypothetical protein AB0C18_15705 [Nonomuraea muscovyensis]|uniref:hypothetical protein n=1 Tax=Nonomuraea muscovyensis TaxID=1124761 RepID=UPI0033D69C63